MLLLVIYFYIKIIFFLVRLKTVIPIKTLNKIIGIVQNI